MVKVIIVQIGSDHTKTFNCIKVNIADIYLELHLRADSILRINHSQISAFQVDLSGCDVKEESK